MANWDHGYVTDITYVNNHYRECSPSWIAAACLLLGHRPPDTTRPYRYADLGCGNGFTALATAAASPQAEVWAFDFNPAHVENGRLLADAAGLTNIHFVEASFADLRHPSRFDLPDFDFIVSHGVLSWISPENRAHLYGIIGERLRPGGVAYISYNVSVGWAAMVPTRHLMRLLAESRQERSDQAALSALGMIDQLRTRGAAYFASHPPLTNRLEELGKHSPRYLAHEYLNRDWHPVMFSDVATAMKEVKCGYLGSATLAENIDPVSVPQGMAPLMAEISDPIIRETLRDFGCNQGFRRDLYRRGVQPLPISEHTHLLDRLSFAWTGMAAADPININTPLGQVQGKAEIYQPLMAMLLAGPLSVGTARNMSPFAGRPLQELLQALTLITSAGYAHPLLAGGDRPEARAATTRLNKALALMGEQGSELFRLASPILGTALVADLLELFMVADILSGKPAEVASLTQSVVDALGRAGRTMQRDGQPVVDPREARKIVETEVTRMLETRQKLWQLWGVV